MNAVTGPDKLQNTEFSYCGLYVRPQYPFDFGFNNADSSS